jgi:hypothetical protein
MRYVEKTFSVRVRLRDGTWKMLLGVQGIPTLGHKKRIRIDIDRTLAFQITAMPARGEPAQAIEL